MKRQFGEATVKTNRVDGAPCGSRIEVGEAVYTLPHWPTRTPRRAGAGRRCGRGDLRAGPPAHPRPAARRAPRGRAARGQVRGLPDLERVPGKQNWVDKAGGLPSYIERIAKGPARESAERSYRGNLPQLPGPPPQAEGPPREPPPWPASARPTRSASAVRGRCGADAGRTRERGVARRQRSAQLDRGSTGRPWRLFSCAETDEHCARAHDSFGT